MTTALVWPRNVIAEIVVAEARGSMSVICRAEEPAARRLSDDNEVSENSEWDVDLVSTHLDVGISHVFKLWSQEVEYATV